MYSVLEISALEMFPDLYNNKGFGGTKRQICIEKRKSDYVIYYINEEFNISYNRNFDNTPHNDKSNMIRRILNEYLVTNNSADFMYLDSLITRHNILKLNMVYDLNSKDLVEQINQTKRQITIENYDELKKSLEISSDMLSALHVIKKLLCSYIVVNKVLYANMYKRHTIYNLITQIKKYGHSMLGFTYEDTFEISIYNQIVSIKKNIDGKFYFTTIEKSAITYSTS
jgi:hypothetical protein